MPLTLSASAEFYGLPPLFDEGALAPPSSTGSPPLYGDQDIDASCPTAALSVGEDPEVEVEETRSGDSAEFVIATYGCCLCTDSCPRTALVLGNSTVSTG